MSFMSIAALVIILVLAYFAIQFLVGLVRTVVSAVLFALAAGIVLSLVTGQDLVSPTVAVVVKTVNSTMP